MPETEALQFIESNSGWVTAGTDPTNLNKTATLHYGEDGGGFLEGSKIDYQIFLNLKEKGFIAFTGTETAAGKRYKITEAGRRHINTKTDTS